MIKKRMLIIGIFLVVCALVAVAILLISKIEPPTEPEPENLDFGLTVNDEGIKVYRFSPQNVDYMEITNPHETYRVRMEGDNVYIVGYETIPLLSASSAGLFNSVSTLSLETVVDEDCQDLSRFGLDDPQASITIQAYSDANVTFFIGDASPTGDYYYMSVKGETTVYLMEDLFAERYLKSVAEYCDKKIYKTFDPAADFRALKVKSPTLNYSFRQATEEEKAINGIYFSNIAMESPYQWGVESSVMEDLMTTMVDLSADDVVQMCVDEQDLVPYGLDAASRTEIVLTVYADPNPTMYNNTTYPYYNSSLPTGQYSEYTVTYWLGNTVDKQVYVMFEGRPVVYSMPKDTFSWLEWTPYRYCTKMLFGEYISNLKSLTVSSAEGEYTFTLSGADSDDKEDLRVNCGTVSVDGASFRNFYTNIMAMYPSGEGAKPENAAPVLTVSYHTVDGGVNTLRFYSVDSRNCVAEVRGQAFLTVRITEVQKVINDTQKLLKGQEILS